MGEKLASVLEIGITHTRQRTNVRPVTEQTGLIPVVTEKKTYMDPSVSVGVKYRFTESRTQPGGAIDFVVLYTKHFNADIYSDGLEFNWRISFGRSPLGF